jgi:hypothetical protein
MTGTNHGITGAAIALLVREPVVAIPLSYASHFVCDVIPHFDMTFGDKLFGKKFNITLICDFFAAATLMILFGFLFPSQKWIIWACMIVAASPDLAWAYYYLYSDRLKHRKLKPDPITRWHSQIQWSQTLKGGYVEAVWFLLMGLIILTRR